MKASLFYRRNKSSCLPAPGNKVFFAFCFLWLDGHQMSDLDSCTAEKMRTVKEAGSLGKGGKGREKAWLFTPYLHLVLLPPARFQDLASYGHKDRLLSKRDIQINAPFSVNGNVVRGLSKRICTDNLRSTRLCVYTNRM